MVFVSLTRLRIRSAWFMPGFTWHAVRSNAQVKRAKGFLHGGLLPDRERTFWTMTVWDSEASMRAYMLAGNHNKAMPHLMNWCNEASVAHWEQESEALPSWEEANQRMRASGRVSKVRHPSAQHAALECREPRTTRGVAIQRAS